MPPMPNKLRAAVGAQSYNGRYEARWPAGDKPNVGAVLAADAVGIVVGAGDLGTGILMAGDSNAAGSASGDLISGAGGAPTISGVSGTLTQGSTITVSGSGFSTKRNGQLVFEAFTGGNVGDTLSSINSNFVAYGGSDPVPNQYLVSASNPYIGSRNARIVAGLNSNPAGAADDMGNAFYSPAGLKELYVESATYLTYQNQGANGDGGGSQTKWWRMNVEPAATTSRGPWMGFNRFCAFNSSDPTTNNGIAEWHVGDDSGATGVGGYIRTPSDSPYIDMLPAGQWNQVAIYNKLSSTPGANDGRAFFNINGRADCLTNSNWTSGGYFSDPTNTGTTNRAWNSAPAITWGASDLTTDIFHYLQIAAFYKKKDMAVTVDIGYIYLNDSPERVVFHNASTLAASSKYQVQKQNSRGANSISVEFQQGNLLTTGSLWATVVNSDNTFSASYQVR